MRDRTIAAARDSLRRRLPARWCAELFQNCDGEWSLVVIAPDDDASTYVIAAGADGYELAALTDDRLDLVHRDDSLAAILAAALALTGRDDDRRKRAA